MEDEETKNAITDILDVDISDPLRAVLAIERAISPRLDRVNNDTDAEAIVLYYHTLKHACGRFGIEFSVPEPQSVDNYFEARRLHNLIRAEIERKKIDLLYEQGRRDTSILLDNSWREKIHSYIAVIRQIIEASDASVSIKESMLSKLHALDAEIDRGRTRVEIFTDVLVGLCEAIGAGATALTPAVRLIERVIGALTRLHPDAPTLALPPPDDYGLKDPHIPASDPNTPIDV